MNDLPFADLHVHSHMSDGTMSPEQILKKAESVGVGLLAIADHDLFDGSSELLRLSSQSSVVCVSAAEITCSDNGRQIHILCYRPDLTNKPFIEFVADGRKKLDMMSVRLIEKMEKSGFDVNTEEFSEFEYDRSGGGWKALHYFSAKGIVSDIKDAIPFYDRFGCGYETAGFPSVKTAVEKIHAANGIAVLAHPGVSLNTESADGFTAEIEKFVSYGADGIECFYPEHSEEITALCERFCDERGLIKTCGSDCHGDFNSHPIAVPQKRADSLRLGGILKR